jgi:NADPH:quinone reductase-like Zn-dependent oxidoreductase
LKALVRTEYGGPERLSLIDVEEPEPRDHEVKVQISHASLNASDWEFLTGDPFYGRIHGMPRPKKTILGSDIAGVVTATGKKVTEFKTGDAVYGDIMEAMGGFAEVVCLEPKLLRSVPRGLTLEQAAALPQSGSIAVQGTEAIEAGQRVLINGGGGGSGTLAIQLAKLRGAHVTAIDNEHKIEVMRECGADEVLDYRRVDFGEQGETYDLILDLFATRHPHRNAACLNPGGTCWIVGGPLRRVLQFVAWSLPYRFVGKRLGMLALKPMHGLESLAGLIADGKVSLKLDEPLEFDDAIKAMKQLGEGRVRGKLVLRMPSRA